MKIFFKTYINKLGKYLKRKINNNYPDITIVSQFFPPDFAATGQLLDELSDGFANSGYKVEILTGLPYYAYKNSNVAKKEFFYNKTIRRTSTSKIWPKKLKGRLINSFIYCLRVQLNLLFRLNRQKLLIYTSEPPFLPYFSYLLSFLNKTPFVVIIYDIYPDLFVKLGFLSVNNIFYKLLNFLNSLYLKKASEIVVLSNPMAELIIRKYPFVKEKLNIISSWSNHTKIYPIKKENNWFVKENKLKNDFIILYSGNQGRCHDLKTIVETAYLIKNKKDIKFIFIGKGAQNKKIRDLAINLSLKNILFFEYQEFKDLTYTLNVADIACVTQNESSEGIVAPSKLYGHLAASTPIAAITPKNSYIKEMV